jgi:hypothetical protein
MSEINETLGHLAKDVRFCFPLVGSILFALTLITFEHLGAYQQLAPIFAIYTLIATAISWAHTTCVYLFPKRIGLICLFAFVLQTMCIIAAIELMCLKKLI